jgi:hypothetical protein
MNKRTISYGLCLTLAAACHISSAAIVTLTPTNTSTSLGTGLFSAQTQLDSVTIGTTTYTEVTFGTPGMVPASGTELLTLTGKDNGGIRVMYVSASSPYTLGSDATAAQTDSFITTGQANLLQDDAGGGAGTDFRSVNFDFGTTFASSADVYITAFEFGGTSDYDSVTLQLLDGSGATVGNTVTVSGDSWGNLVGSQDYKVPDDNISLGNFTVGGAAIPLADFGFTGSIAGVQMSGVGGADIGGIGFVAVAVPEPSTYAILAGMLALGCVMLRRRLRD